MSLHPNTLFAIVERSDEEALDGQPRLPGGQLADLGVDRHRFPNRRLTRALRPRQEHLQDRETDFDRGLPTLLAKGIDRPGIAAAGEERDQSTDLGIGIPFVAR